MSFDPISLRDAQAHLERAKALDPENVVASGFLEKVLLILVADTLLTLILKLPALANLAQERKEGSHDSDDESMALTAEYSRPPQKRVKMRQEA